MDINSISSLSGASFAQKASDITAEAAKTNAFKDELDKASASGDNEKIMEAAKTFESYFINMLFKQMRSTINYSDGMFERSNAEVLFQEMLDEQYSEIATESGGIGLAKSIFEQMTQE